MKIKFSKQGRREFLHTLGTGAMGLVLSSGRMSASQKLGSKPLRGIFPIAQTPFTESNKLDLDSLVREVRFIDRGKVHGFVWPQLASEWETLTEAERLEGAEAIASTGKKLRPAIVIGVQGSSVAAAVKYAKHAEKSGADAIISLPPSHQTDAKLLLEYYQEVGRATELPLFVQAVGTMSVDIILEMYRNVPTLRYVKDEAGQPLARISTLREKSNDQLKIFTGSHGRTLIDEMIRGISGSMPAASFADIYAAAWDLWHEGKEHDAVAMFGNAAVLINEISTYDEGMKYILYLRGVFDTYLSRKRGPDGGIPGAALATPASSGEETGNRVPFDDTAKQVLRKILDLMKPDLRA
ncbi:MAG TPA: dihydrodipicolinate synthase family protein [Desulfomonilaceae bacterium]|nr:dihydrodipicolinate synthase family protein [Desulfomonilaceae bacterium]HVN81999.1 dihydrodipicolinate synthase family protein [Terriglobia bacterium]